MTLRVYNDVAPYYFTSLSFASDTTVNICFSYLAAVAVYLVIERPFTQIVKFVMPK